MKESLIKRVILTYLSHSSAVLSEDILKKFRQLTDSFHSETETLFLMDDQLLKMAELPFTRISHLSSPSYSALHRHSLKNQLYLWAQNLRERTARTFFSHPLPELNFTLTASEEFQKLCRESSDRELLALGPLQEPLSPVFFSLLQKILSEYKGPLLLFDSVGLLSRHIVLLYREEAGQLALDFASSLAETFDSYVFTVIVHGKYSDDYLRILLKKMKENFPKFDKRELEIYRYYSLNSLTEHLYIRRGSTVIIPSSHPILDRFSPIQLFQFLHSPIAIL